MGDYKSVRGLIVEVCMAEGQLPSYEALTALVMEHFPGSKWKKTHYSYYKSMINTGRLEIPGLEGQNIVSNDDTAIEDDIEETVNVSLSIERDLHNYLENCVGEIEKGLTLVDNGSEYTIDAGRIDLLAKDAEGRTVVVELKAGKAKDSALGQLLGYMGCLVSEGESNVRGILVASDFDARVVYAVKTLPHVKLVKYRVAFSLEEVE